MQRIVEDHRIVQIESPSAGNFFLTLESPIGLPEIKPGNFAEILVPNAPEVFLRRPFSILDVDHEKRHISFYIKVLGKGTRRLGELRPGDTVNLIYPLGNSFTLPEPGARALVIGGGSGIAPFILLGKELKKNNCRVTFVIGGRTGRDILLTNQLSEYGTVLVTTEDGSLGEKGLVTGHTVFSQPDQFDRIFTCGPDGMMKAVSKIAAKNRIPCEASLEHMMACGFGICLCCVTATQDGNKRVCWEGPVFNTNYLKWND